MLFVTIALLVVVVDDGVLVLISLVVVVGEHGSEEAEHVKGHHQPQNDGHEAANGRVVRVTDLDLLSEDVPVSEELFHFHN